MAAVAPATRLVVRTATGSSALELLDERWDELLRDQPLPNPTLGSTWLRALARWETGTPLVAVAEQDGRLRAAAALELRRRGRLAPVVATWLGPVEQQFSADVLGEPEAAAAIVDAVLEHADVLTVGAPASGVAPAAVAAAAPWRVATTSGPRWILRCPAPRLEHVRREVARDLRHAASLGAGVESRIRQRPEDVAPALERMFRLHRARWRDRPGETPRFATTARHRAWNRDIFLRLAAGGDVRLVEVVEDGAVVAASLGLRCGSGALAHTTAMRPGGALHNPGLVAALVRYEALAADGAAAIDLGVSSCAPGSPKARLGPEPDPIVLLFAASSPLRQRALLGLQRAARRLRS
jgi:CelD/BcsL family acetyltransferase involved in cellulose biosynthesis